MPIWVYLQPMGMSQWISILQISYQHEIHYLNQTKRTVCGSTDGHSRCNCLNCFMEVEVVQTFFHAPSIGCIEELCGLDCWLTQHSSVTQCPGVVVQGTLQINPTKVLEKYQQVSVACWVWPGLGLVQPPLTRSCELVPAGCQDPAGRAPSLQPVTLCPTASASSQWPGNLLTLLYELLHR